MSQPNPFTTVTNEPQEDRDFIPMGRCKGKLMIVRPLEYKRDGIVTKHQPDGTDAVFADFAVLDPILPWTDEYGQEYKGFPAGQQFRGQMVLQGYLKGTFKRYIGSTLIGTVYFGQPTKGKPPIMWQDLSGDAQCVARGQSFMAARPEFLIPVEATITPVVEESGFHGYQQPGRPQQYGSASGGGQWSQPDPWAQGQTQSASAAPVSAQPVSPAQPSRNQSTLDQLRNMGSVNHQGQPQSSDVPF